MKYFPKKLTIKWIRNSYKSGKLKPVELIEEIIKRVEGNKDKNIWITKPSMDFIKVYLDNLSIKDIEEYPLWGIPFAVKDNIDVKGLKTTAACEKYGYIAKESAFVVNKLVEAGAIPIGKTNLDQFATGLVGTRSPYGEVHNALDDELISGGSSSGSAVSVALGEAAFALGTDTAGSGRVPAALNNLVGYKPSLGAWSTKGVVPACASLDCVTVFANNLEEAEIVNSYARGFDDKCPWSKEYKDIVKDMPKVIYLPKDEPEFYGQFKDMYRAKWNEAVERLKTLEVEVKYIDYSIFQEAASILYDGPWVAERYKDLGRFIEENKDDIFPVTKTILESGNKDSNTAVKMFEAIHRLQEIKMISNNLLKNAVMIMPTAGGTFTRDEVREDPIKTNSLMGKYTNHCNLLNMCAIAVPERSNDTKLPFGITIFSLAENEGLILKTAEEFLKKESIDLAVCGLHMEGMELNSQLIELDAKLVGTRNTSSDYKLVNLNTTPAKPGLIRVREDGKSIEIEVYRMPVSSLGKFLTEVKHPLAIGDIELEDGQVVKGFICEGYVKEESLDISDYKSFRKYISK